MKSKLEEKKLELANNAAIKQYPDTLMFGAMNRNIFRDGYLSGFDAGVSAYKEMLEDSEGFNDLMNDNQRLENELQQQAEKIESLKKENEKLKGAKLAYYMTPDRLRLGKTSRLIIDMIQQMRPNSEIKVTCPDVEQLESRLKEHEDKGLVIYGRKIELLESRLKEAESVIGFYADRQSWFDITKYKSDNDYDAETDRVYGGKLARQYMEKVK